MTCVTEVSYKIAGGAIATYMGWRWIFIISILFALVAMWLIKDAPESRAESSGAFKFDFVGLRNFLDHDAGAEPTYHTRAGLWMELDHLRFSCAHTGWCGGIHSSGER